MGDNQMYIDARWCEAASQETYEAINPARGEPFGAVAKGAREDARRAIDAANKAAKAIGAACFFGAGQVCSSAERIFVDEEIKSDFVDAMVTESKGWVSGDVTNPLLLAITAPRE